MSSILTKKEKNMDKDFDLDEYEKGVKENKKYHKISMALYIILCK